MSYTPTFRGFGALVTAKDCAPGAVFNATDNECYCPPGMSSSDTFSVPCKAIDVTTPCTQPGTLRNPVDKKCECPPGTIMNPDPRFSNCIPGFWFPDCVDASGNRIPDCVRGISMTRALPLVGAALLTGVALAFLYKAAVTRGSP